MYKEELKCARNLFIIAGIVICIVLIIRWFFVEYWPLNICLMISILIVDLILSLYLITKTNKITGEKYK